MKDAITLDRIKLLHPIVRDEAEAIYNEICDRLTGRATCRFTHTLRTFEEQDKLYAQTPKITNAKGGQSWHNYGLAIDIVLLLDKGKTVSYDINQDFDQDGLSDFQECVYVFGLYGWEWGGNFRHFKDNPHFQKTFGLTIGEALQRYNTRQVVFGNYIKIDNANTATRVA